MNMKRLVLIITLLSSTLSYAAPQGGSVVAGNAAISQSGNVTQINQNSDKAVINWQSFDTNPAEQVKFIQPASSSIALNRITSGLPTNFQGLLTANGNVWIVNPAGVLFTSTSRVDVGGLLATTSDIQNNDFMNSNYHFTPVPGFENSTVINNGEINTIADNGLVALVAPGVENNGVITANVGKVVLASGTEYTLDMYGDNLIQFAAPTPSAKVSVSNNGLIQANNGQVLLTANAASNVVNNVVSMNGVIEATNAVQSKNGVIILGGSGGITKVSGKIVSNKIIIKGNNTIISGELDAGNGGYIETSGDYLDVNNSKINMTNGTWLLDPVDIYVVAGSSLVDNDGPPTFTPSPIFFMSSQIGADLIVGQLNAGTSVILDTNVIGLGSGTITINSPIIQTTPSAANLTLNANNAITINSPITMLGTGVLTMTSGGGKRQRKCKYFYGRWIIY